MPEMNDRTNRYAEGLSPRVEAPAPATEESSPAPSWEDNPLRLRGLGWEGSFADTGLGSIIALAVLVGPVALTLGVFVGLRLRGPRARRNAWIMAAVAAPVTAVWVLVIMFGHKG